MHYNRSWGTRAHLHAPIAGVLLSTSLFTASTVRANLTPFVDNYATNDSANKTTDTNAALQLLSSYSKIWTTGDAWNTGSPTTAGSTIIAENFQYVADVTKIRTQALAKECYLFDRRDQSFSAIMGLDDLAASYMTGAGAYSTIADIIPDDALTAKYDDKGNGAGDATSDLGKVVTLVNTLRGDHTSTSPAKTYFLSPRPWRVNTSVAVVSTGTDTKGYYTSTLSDGTPDKSVELTYFPTYDSDTAVNPYLMAARSTTPAKDGGFPSGHTNAAYLASIALAYAVPERFDSIILNASEIGDSRIVAGMHSPLDVIGGRIEATALGGAILYGEPSTSIKAEAYAQAHTYFASELANDTPIPQAVWAACKVLYTERMTYGLSTIGDTSVAAIVPKGAESLLETRFAYLDAAQRREVLRTTEIASGQAVEDSEGWSRLNLFAASGAYGSFDSTVTVNMDAEEGGLCAKDYWRNDITGTGGLVKQGSGTLVLCGDSSYAGDTTVGGGKLVIEGSIAPAEINVSSGSFAVDGGATVTCSGFSAGKDGPATVSISASGSLLEDSGSFSMGTEQSAALIINNKAMLVTDGAITIGDKGSLCLSGGYWAIKGQTTASAVTTDYSITVYNGTAWAAASASDLTATYYDGTTNVWSSSSLYAAYGSKIDLTGYTIITGGNSYLGWSDCGAPDYGWNDSSWYGSFYSDSTFGNWIYHQAHGWQYISDAGDGSIYAYDIATGNWLFTSDSFYPYIYDYKEGTWLFYVGGTTPNRIFWNYNDKAEVNESSL